MPCRMPLRGRASLVVVDQGVTCLGNVALMLLVAHAVPLPEFGRYALVLAAYQVLATLAQALVGEPLLVLAGRTSVEAAGGAVALSLALGGAAGATIATACAILPCGPLLVLAALLPGLLLHDCLRHLAYSRGRAHLALACDAVWAVTQLAATVAVVRAGHPGVSGLVLAWGAPAWLAATALAVPLGAVPRFAGIRAWIHASRRLGRRYLGTAAGSAITVQAALYLTGALAGIATVGQLRLVQAMFDPLHVAVTAARAFGVSEVRRRPDRRRNTGSLVRAFAVPLGGTAALWTVALAPAGLGRALAGPAWTGLAAVVWMVGARAVLESVGAGPFVLHQARPGATWTLAVRLCCTLVSLTAVTVLAGRWGVRGAAAGMLSGSALAVTCWWTRYLGDLRRATVPRDRPVCHVVSHSYTEPEAAGNLRALAEHLRVTLIAPKAGPVLAPVSPVAAGSGAAAGYDTLCFTRVPRHGPAYLLASLRLGMAGRPDRVIIEYDPWTPVFWQALLAAKLFGGAGVYIAVEKNTFPAVPARAAAARRALARAGLRHVDGVMATSHLAARLYEREFGYPGSRIWVLPRLAVDTAAFRPATTPAPAGRLRIGFAGPVDRRRGVHTLLHSFALVREQIPRAELHLMGPVDPDLADDIARLRLRGGLRVHPAMANARVAAFLRGVDIFVLPSARERDHEEHDGGALLAAMATGLPCVGSDSGITPELLFPDNGLVFPAGDHLGLAEELLRLAKDSELRSRLGGNAREFVLRVASLPAVAGARAAVLTAGPGDGVAPG